MVMHGRTLSRHDYIVQENIDDEKWTITGIGHCWLAII